MNSKRYFIGFADEGWEAFSTTECTDPQCRVDLKALAKKHGYVKCDGEYIDLKHAELAVEKYKRGPLNAGI